MNRSDHRFSSAVTARKDIFLLMEPEVKPVASAERGSGRG